MALLNMQHDVDPKQKIAEEIGDISNVEIFNNQVLVKIYERPEKTKSGLIITDKTRDEDRYQSKVGLVVAMGPTAFDDPSGKWFDGVTVHVGDWLVFRPADGWPVSINGCLCRMLDDTLVKLRVDHPDRIW